jgi:hypothetical protein
LLGVGDNLKFAPFLQLRERVGTDRIGAGGVLEICGFGFEDAGGLRELLLGGNGRGSEKDEREKKEFDEGLHEHLRVGEKKSIAKGFKRERVKEWKSAMGAGGRRV